VNTFTVLTAEGFSLFSSENRRVPVNLSETLLVVRGLVKRHKGERGATKRAARACCSGSKR
jgi:hypothetical protein